MDKEYWIKYYEKNKEAFEPSNFAKFVLPYMNRHETIVDLGCGNGRDTIFFGQNGINAIGIDQCENVVDHIDKIKYPNVKVISNDFTNITEDINTNHLYSRFTLHSIDEAGEDRMIEWAKNNINGYFFIEVRSDKDALVGKKTDHYRRFANIDKLLIKLINNGFNVVYSELSRGFSEYKNKYGVHYNESDPMLIRIIVERKM